MTDSNSSKYVIQARITASGVVERSDVVGAIFGQTEGLLGNELDLRDMQKSGRMGRIEVDIKSSKGKSIGEITIASSMDQVETSVFAAALETVERVGPCKATLKVISLEDSRAGKRDQIIERARELLLGIVTESRSAGVNITDSVRQLIQTDEIVSYGGKLPAGPNVENSDAVILVEGRSDVLNLLRHSIKNAISVEGTNIPKEIVELCKSRTVTAFVDGDRGGEMILRELFQVAEINYVARAPTNTEVEHLGHKQIMKCLRDKSTTELFKDQNKWARDGKKKRSRRGGRKSKASKDEEAPAEASAEPVMATPAEEPAAPAKAPSPAPTETCAPTTPVSRAPAAPLPPTSAPATTATTAQWTPAPAGMAASTRHSRRVNVWTVTRAPSPITVRTAYAWDRPSTATMRMPAPRTAATDLEAASTRTWSPCAMTATHAPWAISARRGNAQVVRT